MPESVTSPPPLSRVTSRWMPLTCMLPPPLSRSTGVSAGTSRVAFSPQLPVGRRQSRVMAVLITVKSGWTRLYSTVPVSRAVPLLAWPWRRVMSPPPVLATSWPCSRGMVR